MKKVRAKKSTIRIREVIAKILIIICLITNINTNYIVLAQDESEKTEIETAIEWLKNNQNEDVVLCQYYGHKKSNFFYATLLASNSY